MNMNLCELLKGHEGEKFYSLAHGDVMLDHVFPSIDSCIVVKIKNGDKERFYWNGRWLRDGIVMLFPSHALYQQYPLDPLKAWSVWQDEHNKTVSMEIVVYTQGKESVHLPAFYTSLADRDKCIEEINAIIEKYRK